MHRGQGRAEWQTRLHQRHPQATVAQLRGRGGAFQLRKILWAAGGVQAPPHQASLHERGPFATIARRPAACRKVRTRPGLSSRLDQKIIIVTRGWAIFGFKSQLLGHNGMPPSECNFEQHCLGGRTSYGLLMSTLNCPEAINDLCNAIKSGKSNRPFLKTAGVQNASSLQLFCKSGTEI